jgi:hypothetical protein
MTKKLAQKTFKVEIEITVDMEEVEEEHLPTQGAADRLTHLKRLQQALLKNEAALTEQMLSAALDKLQEYLDYLVTQDNMRSLEKVADSLEREERQYFEKNEGDFTWLTRPLRQSSLVVRLESGTVHERVNGGEAEAGWQTVWSDLMQESKLTGLLEQLSITVPLVYSLPHSDDDHHLLPRFLSRQSDGVHMEGRCTCDKALEGVGEDELQALEALWVSFSEHYEDCDCRSGRSPDIGSPGLSKISKS